MSRKYKIDLYHCPIPLEVDTEEYLGSLLFETEEPLDYIERTLLYDGEILQEAVSWDVTEFDTVTVINVTDFASRLGSRIDELKSNNQINWLTPEDISTPSFPQGEGYDLLIYETGPEENETFAISPEHIIQQYSQTNTYNWGASDFFTKVFASITAKISVDALKQLATKGIGVYYHLTNQKISYVKQHIASNFDVKPDKIWLENHSKRKNREKFVFRDLYSKYTIVMEGSKVVTGKREDIRNFM